MPSIKFYLDADSSQRIAQIVRRLDPAADITSAQELGHVRVLDPDELAHATAEGRCLITRNYPDFNDRTTAYQGAGRTHAGILLIPSSLAGEDFTGITRAIVQFAHEYPDGLPGNFVGFLRRVR